MRNFGWVLGGMLLVGCTSSSTDATPSGSGTTSAAASCDETAGAKWSLEKSRFAFGGTPVEDHPGHWTGPTGAGAGGGNFALFSLNGDSPDRNRPDFSADPEVMQTHVTEYLEGFGIQRCQIASSNVGASGGGGGPVGGPFTPAPSHLTISLTRAIDGIVVSESNAYAMLDDEDKSTSESLFWPALTPEVIAAAKALRTRLADPATLAAYRAKFTNTYEYRTEGAVTIHHTLAFGDEPLKFWASYDTMTTGMMPVSFDEDGNLLEVGGGPKSAH